MPGFDPAAFRAEQRRGEPRPQRAADDLSSLLSEARRVADGLYFACRLPDKKPDFTACGGPAAEAYWEYFTSARIRRLLAAVDAALSRHVEAVIEDMKPEPFHYCKTCSGHPAWPCPEVAAITTALAGEKPGKDENHD